MTGDTWHATHDTWHMTHSVGYVKLTILTQTQVTVQGD